MTVLQNNFTKIELVQPNYFHSCLKSKWRVWRMPSGASPGGGIGIAMILFIFLIMKPIYEKKKNTRKGFGRKAIARRSWWVGEKNLLHVTSWSDIGPWSQTKWRHQDFRISCSLKRSRSSLFLIWQRIWDAFSSCWQREAMKLPCVIVTVAIYESEN